MSGKKSTKLSRSHSKKPDVLEIRYFWDDWLERNRYRFTHQPVISKSDKNSLTMQFTGINPVLTAVLNLEREIGIYVTNTEGEYWDCIAEFDVKEQQTPEGQFYCGYCDEPSMTLYPTRQALWEQHVFELLLEWCNAKFQPDCFIVLWGSHKEGWWGARLLTKEQVVTYGYADTLSLPLLVDTETVQINA
jgi:hypothetical protein